MRRQFSLPAEDMAWLEGCGLPYELVSEGGVLRVVLHNHPVPAGYNVSEVSVNVRIDAGYPDAQIDMAYFHPDLTLTSGRPIGAVSADAFDSRVWQRWSRHRTPTNPWRPGVDGLATHFALVEQWLNKEASKA